MVNPSCVRCLLCDSIIATSGSKYEDHLKDWHNVTVQRMLKQLMWMSPYDEDISENQEVEGGREEEAVKEHLELQEEKQSEEHQSSSSFSPSIKFNPYCVVQSNSGKVHKFLHIDESIGGHQIKIKGQSLLVLPDTISIQVPDCSTQEEIQKNYGELEKGDVTKMGKKRKTTDEEENKKLLCVEKMVKTHKMKKNCSHCGLNLSTNRNLARHIERFHNPTRGLETKKFLEGDFKCQEASCKDISFKYRETLVAHQRNKHGAPMLQCLHQGCGMQFSWAYSLRSHMKKHKI